MHRPARCRDREWTGGVDDPQPDRHTGKIAIRSEFLSSLSAFLLGRLAGTGDYNVGCASDLDFRYHTGRLSGEPLSTPETETSCFYFWSAANGYRQNDPEATEQLYRENAPTFLEDKEMVQAQQRRLDELGEQGLVDIASDANRMHMRRIVELLIVSEQSAAAAK
jgi:hypothetical protein